MKIIGVIPARYKSTRLEGKPLADIHGKPMIQYVYEAARKAQTLDSVIIATDDERVSEAVRRFGGAFMMTNPGHSCGTDRVAEVAAASDAAIIVNIQGDEPLMDPRMIDECVAALRDNAEAGMSTVIKKIGEAAYRDPAVVKVVRDTRGRALYFSRSLIPFPRHRTEDFEVFEHLGLYAYTRDCLVRFSQLAPTPLEKIEGLEQLRALENGIAIQTVETRCQGELVSIDTPEDLRRVREILAKRALS